MQCKSANITLDTKCYTSIIHAFSKSNDKNSASHARKLLDEMNRLQKEGLKGVSPNTFTYTAVINACTSAQDVKSKKEAFQIARQTFDELLTSPYLRPNQVTYESFVKVCTRCVDDYAQRKILIYSTFDKCCEDGFVTAKLLKHMRLGLSHHDYQGIVSSEKIGLFDTKRLM